MKKFFNVAGHVFSAVMDDKLPIWDKLSNYAPFEVDSTDPIFTLEVVESLDTEGAELVYLDDRGEEDMSRIDIYHIGEDWLFRMAPNKKRSICAELRISADFTQSKLALVENSLWAGVFAFNNAMMLSYAFRTCKEDTLQMHSSVTVKDGQGYMFLGKSGTGKSTHSSLWLKNIPGTYLLNDDNPIIRLVDGVAMVFGSPWSGKTPCYKQDSAPIGAIVSLEQYPENIIERLSPLGAYAAIYSSCSGFRAEKEIADGLHATMEKIVAAVPFYHLKCLPDAAAAELCSSTVTK